MDGTPIFDIKPYLSYSDSLSDTKGGFTGGKAPETLEVTASEDLLALLPEGERKALVAVLAQDPRPSYQKDPHRVYAMSYGGFTVEFTVADKQLQVVNIRPGV